jgi:hypothetical protein
MPPAHLIEMLLPPESQAQRLIDIDGLIAHLEQSYSFGFRIWGFELTQDSGLKARDRTEAR